MSDDPHADPFAPPELSTEVCCIHCGETYDSWQIEWRIESDATGREHGFWCCPVSGCDGKGFGFDILPTDPNYEDERGGWVSDDDDDEDESSMNWESEDKGEWSEAEDHPAEFSLDEDIPWDVPDPNPPRPAPPEHRDDWPFSVN